MKIIVAITLFYLASLTTVLAQANFEDIYAIIAGSEYSELANQIVSARFDESDRTLTQKYTRLKNLQARIEAKTNDYSNDPTVWFLTGLNLNNLAETRYLLILDQSTQQKAAADIEVSNYNIARSRAYDNAIRLDSTQPRQLSSAIYATMGYGLSNRQKIKTYSREIELGSASENESNEWFMHWAKIDALVHEKKLEEAQAALAELNQLLQKKNRTDSPYSSIAQRAESQVKASTEQSQARKKSQSKTRPSAKSIESVEQPWSWKNWLLLGIGVFTFVSVIVAAIYMRNR